MNRHHRGGGLHLFTTHPLLLPLLALALLAPVAATAQQSSEYLQHLDSGYVYDPLFQFGALGLPLGKTCPAYDTLGLTFVNAYGASENLNVYLDTAYWHPKTPESVAIRQDDSLRTMFFTDALTCKIKFSMTPFLLHDLAGALWSSENYYSYTPAIDADSSGIIASGFLNERHHNSLDSVPRHPIWAGKFLKTSGTADLIQEENLMAGRNTTTRFGLLNAGGYSIFRHPNGAVYADSSNYHDVTITMKAEDLPTVGDPVIANAVLYRRTVTGQHATVNSVVLDSLGKPTADTRPNYTTCDCQWMEPFDTIAITKAMYVNGRDHSDYKQIALTFRFPCDGTIADSDINIPNVRIPDYQYWSYHWNGVRLDSVGAKTVTVPAILRFDTLCGFQPPGNASWHGWGYKDTIEAVLLADTLPGGTLKTADQKEAGLRAYHNQRYCKLLLDSMQAHGLEKPGRVRSIATESDFYVELYTTRRATITMQHEQVAPHMLSLIGTRAFDSTLNRMLNVLLADSNQWGQILQRVGVGDEAKPQNWAYNNKIISQIQHAMLDHHPNDTLRLWFNPLTNPHSFQRFAGDVDSTHIKMIHMMALQKYTLSNGIPAYYANRKWMDSSINATLFSDQVLANTETDYNTYVANSNNNLNWRISFMRDGHDASYRTFQKYGAKPYPVYFVVQVHGEFEGLSTKGSRRFRGGWRTPTPEEITAQCWATLTQGIDGIVFSDMIFNGDVLGPIHYQTGDHSTEYGRLGIDKPYNLDTLPMMWVGFNSRFNAIKSIIDTFKTVILPTYMKLNRHEGTYTAVHTTSNFNAFPLLDTVLTERARRDSIAFMPLAALDTTPRYDPHDKTLLDVTYFEPNRDSLPTESANQVRYLLFASRRCWPIDHRLDTAYVDSIAGLGNIDVRRPVVRLKNSTTVIADSLRIEKIGGGFSAVVAIDSLVPLEWLKPGWGGLYKITPIPRGIAKLGSSYANAVHATNPSDTATERNRIYVYERDSVIYMRALSPAGAWSREWMISDSLDSGDAGGQRWADNYNPSVAFSRDSANPHLMVVWERRANIEYLPSLGHSVEGCYMRGLPTITALPTDTFRVSLTSRNTIINPPAVYTWPGTDTVMKMTPAIVGVPNGFVAAWATPSSGIEVKAIKNNSASFPPAITAPVTVLANSTDAGGKTVTNDARFPTLAFVKQRHLPNQHHEYQGEWAVHLAWQQGVPYGQIFYHQLRLDTAIGSLQTIINEWVSMGATPCAAYAHPSIAADSVWIGVAYESNENSTRSIRLRFRNYSDTATSDPAWKRYWDNPVYRWGGVVAAGKYRYNSLYYEYPSLTQFPAKDSIELLANTNIARADGPTGAIAWFSSNASGTIPKQWIYRFGRQKEEPLPPGQHPSLALVPRMKGDDPLSASSLFYRGQESEKFSSLRPLGGTTWHYPAKVENTPSNASTSLLGVPGPRKIYSSYKVGVDYGSSLCAEVQMGLTFDIWHDTTSTLRKDGDRDRLFPRISPTSGPQVPDIFFTPPGLLTRRIDSIESGMMIGRTSVFRAEDVPVTIKRLLIGSDDLNDWLDAFPYDSTMGSMADVKIVTELMTESGDSVLWRSDTVSARDLEDTIRYESVEVPVDSVATYGTHLFIRVHAIPTAGLLYSVSGGFDFMTDSSATGVSIGIGKLIRPRTEEAARTGTTQSKVEVQVIPNPITSSGELWLRMTEAGRTTVGIYDMLGRLVKEIPAFDIADAGEYAVELDLSELLKGVYTVRVEQGNYRASTRFTVVR